MFSAYKWRGAECMQRRIELLPEHQSVAYEQWTFNDESFINELCIVFLVALRHHIEGRLIVLAACAADHGKPITKSEFEARMNELKELKNKKWDLIDKRLAPQKYRTPRITSAICRSSQTFGLCTFPDVVLKIRE